MIDNDYDQYTNTNNAPTKTNNQSQMTKNKQSQHRRIINIQE